MDYWQNCVRFPRLMIIIINTLLLNWLYSSSLFAETIEDSLSSAKITNISISNFPEIAVTMSIIDKHDNSIPGLNLFNFQLIENEISQDFVVNSIFQQNAIADIVIMFDTTVSMYDKIVNLKNKIIDFTDSLKASQIDYALGLVTFGDDFRITNQGKLTNSVQEFQSWIAKLKAAGGFSIEENPFDALAAACTMSFRSNAQRIFILITDAPPWLSGKPGSPTKFSLKEIIHLLNNHNIINFVIGPKISEYQSPSGLAYGTGGLFFDIKQVDFSTIVQRIAKIITGQYVLTYSTQNKWADGSHRLVITEVNLFNDVKKDTLDYLAPDYTTTLTLTAPNLNPKVGTPFWIDVNVGHSLKPARNLYGLSFCVEYDIQNIFYKKSTPGTFWGSDTLFREWHEVSDGKIYFSITRKIPPGAEGSGIGCRLNFSSPASVKNGSLAEFKLTQIAAFAPNWIQIPIESTDLTLTLRDTLFYEVWPGDTDNNGVVDEVDILPIGYYFYKFGYSRESASINWFAQRCIAWEERPATFADASGNGQVGSEDFSVVDFNFGKKHTHFRTENATNTLIRSAELIKLKMFNLSFKDSCFNIKFDLHPQLEIKGFSCQLASTQLIGNKKLFQIVAGMNPYFQFVYCDSVSHIIHFALISKKNEIDLPVSVNCKIKNMQNSGLVIPSDLAINKINVLTADGEIIQIENFSAIENIGEEFMTVPQNYNFLQNYPNPFNSSTRIRFDLPNSTAVELEIVDLTGKQVKQLFNQTILPGSHEIYWDGTNSENINVVSGIYFIRIKTPEFQAIRKAILVR